MGRTVWQMVSCGGCAACVAGVPSHGPYPYHFEPDGGGRRHLYGEGSEATSLAPEEEQRLRDEAGKEYEDLERDLTPEQRAQLRNVMGRLAALRRAERAREKEKKERTKEAREKGWTVRALEHLGAEVSAQFEAEISELRAQVAAEKKELRRMLRDGGGK